eukprot:12316128-Heterocapsa_arctica.AAC.1
MGHPGVAVPRQAATLSRLLVRVDGRVAERERVPLGEVPGIETAANGYQSTVLNPWTHHTSEHAR